MVKYFIYLRVSSEQQRDNNRYSYQEDTLVRTAKLNQWEYEIHKEIRSAKDMVKRPVIKRLLCRLACKEADGLMVITADRLTRDVQDATYILDIAKIQNWHLFVDNLRIDNYARFREQFIADVNRGQAELDILSDRTKQGLEKSQKKHLFGGKRLTYSEQMIHRIVYLRNVKKFQFKDIATKLNDEGIPTARPGWGNEDLWTADKTLRAYHNIYLQKPRILYDKQKALERKEFIGIVMERELKLYKDSITSV